MNESDEELDRLRKRMEQNVQNSDRLHQQYEADQKKAREDAEKKKQKGPSVDEVLENDYNSLYDFQ